MTADRARAIPREPVGHTELETLVAEHHERLLRVAMLVCGERADAEDAVQIAFERAWRHIDDLREPARIRAWLQRIVVREALRIERRRRGFFARWLAAPREIEVEPVAHADGDLEVREALERLSAEQRAAVVLHHLEGYSVAETADLLGVPLETARSRLRIARERLRKALGGGR